MDVTVILPTYQARVTLKREVLNKFPKCLFAQAIEDEPETKELTFTQPEVTPETIIWLNDIVAGKVITYGQVAAWRQHKSILKTGAYLNIPFLTVVADEASHALIKRRFHIG